MEKRISHPSKQQAEAKFCILVLIFLDTKERKENFELSNDKYYIYIYMCVCVWCVYVCVCVCVCVCVWCVYVCVSVCLFIYKTIEIVNLRFVKFDTERFYNKLSAILRIRVNLGNLCRRWQT